MIPAVRQLILNQIPENSSVLDLGCGDGTLLSDLYKTKNCHGYGVELHIEHILSCTQKGVSVFHGDINEGLPEFTDQSFDFVVMSQTLQVIRDPILLLKEIVRVGKQGIVVFPNFGHISNRFQLLTGVAPKTKNLPYDWYDTPNIRVITIPDFNRACANNTIHITRNLSGQIGGSTSRLFSLFSSNLFIKYGIFIIQRQL